MYEEQYLIQITKYLLNSDVAGNVLLPPTEGLNWNRLVKIADRHNISSLLYHVMPEISDNQQLSEDIVDSIRKKAIRAAVIDIKQRAEEDELLKRFETEKVFCMPVKGLNTKEYYTKSEWRTMGDLDILYKAEQHKKLKALLQEMGYTGFESGLKHDHYSKKPFITLEMHRGLVAANTMAEAYYSNVWEKAKPREGCKYVFQMSLEEQYIYTMVHLLEHFQNGGIGIRFIMDIFVFSKQEKMDRQYVKSKFAELGISKFASCMEQLAQKWFGNQEGIENVDDGEFLNELETFIIENGVYGQSTHAQDTAIEREGRKGYFTRMVFPNYNSMVTLYPWLNRRKYLMPAAWGIRIVRTMLFRKESIQTGIRTLKHGSPQRGKELLEFYRKCGIPNTAISIGEDGAEVENVVDIIAEEHLDKNVLDFMKILRCVIKSSKEDKCPELNEPVDWKTLSAVSKAHNLFPLFHESACHFPEYRNRPEYEDNINLVMTMIGQQIKKTESFLELYRAFLKEDLHPIVMKGLICRQLYGQHAEKRPSGDEDILVRKEDFYKVKEVMEKQGFVCSQPDVTQAQLEQLQDVGFYESNIGFLIEVHTNIMGHTNQMRTKMGDCFKDVFEHTRTVMIHDVPVTTMFHTDHFLFLVLHAFKHFSLSGVGVRQMLDILLYQNAFEREINWDSVKTVLDDNHAAGYLGDLQFIGEEYLEFEFGVHFETCSPEDLLKDMMEVGVFGKRDDVDILAARINLNVVGQRRGGAFAWIRMGFPPVRYMLNEAPYLEEKPWLLPVEWGKRWGRFFKRARKHGGSFMLDSVKKSRERMELLKKYGL